MSSEQESPPGVRWGILGCARIATKNIQAIRDSGTGTVTAVASRSLERAQEFAEEHQIPLALGSYEELINSQEVDAIYLPIPTGLRTEWAVAAASQGKHVLIEKPAAPSSKDVDKIISAAQATGVQVMDGVMFMHNPRLAAMKELISNEAAFGKLKRVQVSFSFMGDTNFQAGNIRMNNKLEPQGCVGDLGWYCVRFALWAFDYQKPVSVTAQFHKVVNNVPVDVTATLLFGDGKVANFNCSFESCLRQYAEVVGEKAHVFLHDFCSDTTGGEYFSQAGTTSSSLQPLEAHKTESEVSQEALMMQTFNQLARTDQPDPEQREFWPKVTYITQCVLDAIMDSGRRDAENCKVKYGINAL